MTVLARVVAFLARTGGICISPRAQMAALGEEQGRHDGLVYGLLYMLTTGLYPLAESLAALVTLRNAGAGMMVMSVVARIVVVPVATVVLAEFVLGRARVHRRAVALVPLLVLTCCGRLAGLMGASVSVSGTWIAVAGGGVGLVLAWAVRGAIPPKKETP